jgi:DinB superfamily
MPQNLSNYIRRTIETELPNLHALSEARACEPRAPGKWCPKEELGHLIDSAANNHQRFVRAGLSGEFRGPSYAQDEWVRIHGYIDMPWERLVTFWHQYNVLLAELVARIPEARLPSPCFIADYPVAALSFVIDDYVFHMQHHIDQLLQRAVITPYPRPPEPARGGLR